jgi:protein disulfide-isomerase A1
MLYKTLLASLAAASLVVDLTADNYDSFIKENPVTLIEFFAPWCGHCKALAPEYDKASEELKDVVKIAKVDCTTQESLCNQNGVQGFPTLKVFRDGKASEYKGQRTSASIVDTMKRQLAPAVTTVTKDNYDSFKDSDNVVIIATAKKGSDEAKLFSKIANIYRDDFVFGLKEGDKAAITLYKKFDEGKNVFEGKFTESEIQEFIKANSTPLMPDIGPQNYEKLVSTGLPLGFFFHGTEEQKKTYGPAFEKLAKKHKGKAIYVYLDASQYGGFADNLALKQEWPAFGYHLASKSQKFPFDQTKEFTDANLAKFADDFVAGKLEPTKKSDPIPESNDEPVKVVVGKSFESIVYDKTKDVLIEFYARIR